MDTTARRYIAPARPPRLATSKLSGRTPAGVVCLRVPEGRPRLALVTFDWGRVLPSRQSR